MKQFIIRCLIFGSLPVGLGLLIYLITDHRYIPAPMVTNSYCLNEKLFEFKDREPEFLAVGSSITLNNLHSQELITHVGSTDFVNMAAWGMRMDDIFSLTNAYIRDKRPKLVFIASNVDDFYLSKIQFKEEEVTSVLGGAFKLPLYFLHFNPPYYINRYFDNQDNKEKRNTYRSIQFDNYGGVPLMATGFEIDSGRWNQVTAFDKVEGQNYLYLDSLCRFLKEQQIPLVFFQSPIREALLDQDGTRELFNRHKSKVALILQKYDHSFIDGADKIWPDSVFLDYGHMTEEGSRVFTAYCLEKWKDEKVSYLDKE